MEPKKRWDDYVSFSYLEPGLDYREFELSPQIGRVEPFVYPLSDVDHERAERLLSATTWGCTACTRRRSIRARIPSTNPSSTSRGWRTRRSSRT